MQLVLGSQSPRRKEILSYFSLPFVQASPPFDEESIPFEGDPEQYVCALSLGKAKSLSNSYPEAIILSADTIVFCGGKVYGKPKDEEEACRVLGELSGRWHTVYTGVAVQKGGREHHEAEATQVLFNVLNEEQIRSYIANTRWDDKAGGYAIQMAGGLLVRKIDGCYYNVMGLPLNTLEGLLGRFGIALWDHL